jgi:hypothetical protein
LSDATTSSPASDFIIFSTSSTVFLLYAADFGLPWAVLLDSLFFFLVVFSPTDTWVKEREEKEEEEESES